MNYRTIPPPANWQSLTTDLWVDWAERVGAAPSVAPVEDATCSVCFGAVTTAPDGRYWHRCYQCRGYDDIFDVVVPIVYSVDSGLESLLHRYKDWDGFGWVARPLGSLLYEFLERHLDCIEATVGPIDIATTVPPSPDSGRGFDHLEYLVAAVNAWPIQWRHDVLVRGPGARPARAEVTAGLYQPTGAVNITGSRVLLLDDTWTSGSTLASAAAALRQAGAASVAGLTLGRQLHAGYGSADDLIDTTAAHGFVRERCVLC